ncbi:AraC family transcriptional regulator [Halioglobus maricola]|uniref:AraC family transcriptional regulator n=1 Tax=Halioglobus maricola TaxID=2601894 RepID=A0A5P9NKT5_9GAMM|nr:AraC family transcriptional regulator [Halioglobus maricola]QFU76451.1 AraC family transcriptional regulator [Halioglobus maricola]
MLNSGPGAYFIPSSYSRIVARVLQLQERDLPKLLRDTGLPPEVLLAGDESRMSGRQQLQVMDNARTMGRAPDFGLRLGQQLQPSAHGPTGYLALASPDLRTALHSLRDFLPIRIPFAQLVLDEEGDWLSCRVNTLLDAGPAEQRMLMECFALVLQALVESFLSRRLTEARIDFEYPSPAYHAVYSEYLHSKFYFDQADTRVLLPLTLLDEPNPGGDADSYAAAREMCAALLEQVPVTDLTTTDRVRRFLLAQPVGSVGEEQVARSLFVSKRTLARRLAREGNNYRKIRDQLLAEMAARYLRDNRLSVEAVAALLGYHDSANFRRAFKRWHGMPPQSFRAAYNVGDS